MSQLINSKTMEEKVNFNLWKFRLRIKNKISEKNPS